MLDTAYRTIESETWRGLYRGLPISVIGGMPAVSLYFSSYEFFKKHTLKIEFLQNHSFISYLAGGMFAEIIAGSVFVPVDVIKERL